MKIIPTKLIILVLSVTVLTGDICFGSSDFQWWNSANTAFELSKNWTFTFEEQLRMGNDAGTLTRYHEDIGVVYHGLADWIDLGINYRSIERKTNDGDWNHTDRGHLNFTFHGKLFGRDISNRVRLEYETGQAIDEFGAFQNKFTLNPPFELHPRREIFKSYTIKPYVSHELFYGTRDDKITRHRYSVGLSLKLSENWFSKIYYMRQESSSNIYNNLNVLGLQLRYLF
jgi:hypothetical protein